MGGSSDCRAPGLNTLSRCSTGTHLANSLCWGSQFCCSIASVEQFDTKSLENRAKVPSVVKVTRSRLRAESMLFASQEDGGFHMPGPCGTGARQRSPRSARPRSCAILVEPRSRRYIRGLKRDFKCARKVNGSDDDPWLDSTKSVVVAMALHELATNAIKYGALSNGCGRVSIAWERQFQATRVKLVWQDGGES